VEVSKSGFAIWTGYLKVADPFLVGTLGHGKVIISKEARKSVFPASDLVKQRSQEIIFNKVRERPPVSNLCHNGLMTVISITTDQMRKVDQLMVEPFGISLLQMMENAGRSLAEMAKGMLGGSAAGKTVSILCGPGNNGGGGMVAARHLHNWGADVQVTLSVDPTLLKEVPAKQWVILKALRVDQSGTTPVPADLVIDALLGYGVSGDPRPPLSNLICWANEQLAPVLALDAPSGLDTTSGLAHSPTVRASTTLTLALPKTGLLVPAAKKYVGDLYLADIGVPPELYAHPELGLKTEVLFAREAIVLIE